MFELPELGYGYDALEPHIDAKTMEIHHSKHHAAYVDKLNDALKDHEELKNLPIEELMAGISDVPEEIRTAVRNNGGGHYNHSLFWEIMKPGGAKKPEGELLKKIESDLGGFDEMKKKITDAGINRFGSGWSWLAVDSNGNFEVYSTPNQDNPLMEGKKALLGVDVWEHAYYLKYQNRRPDYLKAWWNIVNWDAVAARMGQI